MKSLRHWLLTLLVIASRQTSYSQSSCIEDGFEGLSVGPLSSSVWLGSTASIFNSINCPTSSVVFTAGGAIQIVSTPYIDPNCGNVANSPFTGSNVALINSLTPSYNARTKLSHTISVTASNFVFRYAYKGIFNRVGYDYCLTGSLMFRFFDCANNPLTAISTTVANIVGLGLNTDAGFWVFPSTSNDPAYTPNWVLRQVNLSQYINSCVRVEVIASPMGAGGWPGYMYFDSQCSDRFILGNGNFLPANNSMTVCGTTTLSGLSGFSDYMWQGPPGSGVSGSTLSAVNASVAGIYTLVATTGTNVFTQTVNLTFIPSPTVTISGANTLCVGQTTTLQASGSGITSYTWSNNSNASSVTLTPGVSSTFSVAVTGAGGCVSQTSAQILVYPNPIVTVLSPPPVCMGQSIILNAFSNATVLNWSGGPSTSTFQISPLMPTVYSVTATSSLGCSSTTSVSVAVLPLPAILYSPASPSVCAGNSVQINVTATGNSTFTWSHGAVGSTVNVAPVVSTLYTVTATGNNGCSSDTAILVMVIPKPQPVISVSSASVCEGSSVSISAGGISITSYSWSNGVQANSFTTSIFSNTVFILTAENMFGCVGQQSASISSFALPEVSLNIIPQKICLGEGIVLTANVVGGITFTWSGGLGTTSESSIAAVPEASIIYTVLVTDQNGCSAAASKSVSVSACTDVQSMQMPNPSLEVFPNPATDDFIIRSKADEKVILISSSGIVIASYELNAANNYSTTVKKLSPGVYFVKGFGSCLKIVSD